MLNGLFDRRVLIVLGKGGVGTTTISAALAIAAAEAGRRVLAMEFDLRAPMARLLGAKRSYEPVAVTDRLSTMVLEGRTSLEDYLRLVVPSRIVLRAVYASPLYQFFVQAAPGLKELMMLGRVMQESERNPDLSKRPDLIVLDAPASGRALSILKMPAAAHETFGKSIAGREAHNIDRMFQDPARTAAVMVTIPEQLAITETFETCEALGEIGINLGSIILNRAMTPGFSSRDKTRFAERAREHLKADNAEHLVRLVRAELKRAADADNAFHKLTARTHAPVAMVSEFHGLSGPELVERIKLEITAQSPREGAAHAEREN